MTLGNKDKVILSGYSMALSRDLIAATVEPTLLSILSRQESYGYALIKEVHGLSRGKVNWTEGMLYPVLHRLEKQGLISAIWRASETGRKRRYYTIESKGCARLAEDLEEWGLAHAMLAAGRGGAIV